MSSSPEPETIPTKQKTKEKTKKGSQSAVAATGHGKNEGNDPHWAYKPPPGAVLVDHEVDVGEFEWDNVEDDDDVELWLIRIPDGVSVHVHDMLI
jgi:hypothetical protein